MTDHVFEHLHILSSDSKRINITTINV